MRGRQGGTETTWLKVSDSNCSDSIRYTVYLLPFPEKLPMYNDKYIPFSLSTDLPKVSLISLLAAPPLTLDFSSYASPPTTVSARVVNRGCRSSTPVGIPAFPAPTPSTFFFPVYPSPTKAVGVVNSLPVALLSPT